VNDAVSLRWRVAAEFLGTFALVFAGTGVIDAKQRHSRAPNASKDTAH
jgi:glycerol uptake facilitator-like aquaporin